MQAFPVNLTFSGINTTLLLSILGVLLTQHKVWTRMKDRINILWSKHCDQTGDRYVSVEGNGNGRR